MDPTRRRRTARRLWTAVVAALALPLAMLSTLPTAAHAAALQCSVDYKTNDWGSGFTADLTLTNRGTDPISGWTLTYSYSGNQKLSNGWNGTWSPGTLVTNARLRLATPPNAVKLPPTYTFVPDASRAEIPKGAGSRRKLASAPLAASNAARLVRSFGPSVMKT